MDPIDQALETLGLTIIRPEEIQRAFELTDCRTCFHYTSVLAEGMPLWWTQLLTLEFHMTSHGGNN